MTDTTIDTPGIKGVTRSTWRDSTSLRGLLLRVIAQKPNATRDELEEMYLAKARKKPALVDEALRRAFDNDLARAQQPARQRRSADAAIASVAGNIRTVVLLDLLLPNGKKLRDCTGSECQAAGGWLMRVAERVGNKGIVGQLLNEKQLSEIFAKAR